MTAFIVSTVSVTDAARFQAYVGAVAGLAEKFGGDYVIRGVAKDVLEGEATPGERLVILRFPNAAAAYDFYHSTAYQSAKRLRLGAALVAMRLFEA